MKPIIFKNDKSLHDVIGPVPFGTVLARLCAACEPGYPLPHSCRNGHVHAIELVDIFPIGTDRYLAKRCDGCDYYSEAHTTEQERAELYARAAREAKLAPPPMLDSVHLSGPLTLTAPTAKCEPLTVGVECKLFDGAYRIVGRTDRADGNSEIEFEPLNDG